MTTLAVLGLVTPLAHATLGGLLPRFTNRKVGGIRFIRLGRLQLSFCICRK